jgi:hypothetical protein
MKEHAVRRITHTDRYIAARAVLFNRLDHEFLAMKPAVFNALRRGLDSGDEGIALRASEQWMRAAGFMHYGKGEARQGLTAEDVAKQMLQLNLTLNVKPGQQGRGS